MDIQTVSCIADVIGDDKGIGVDILWYKQVWNKYYVSFVSPKPMGKSWVYPLWVYPWVPAGRKMKVPRPMGMGTIFWWVWVWVWPWIPMGSPMQSPRRKQCTVTLRYCSLPLFPFEWGHEQVNGRGRDY